MSLLKSTVIATTMLLSSIEARAWSDNNGSNQSAKENDFNKKPTDMFKEKDFKDDLTSKAIMNNDKLLLIAPPQPVPSHLPLQYKPMEINATPSGSPPTKLVIFDDKALPPLKTILYLLLNEVRVI